MLVLSRKVGQQIVVDDRVTLTITRISGSRVSVGILAPPGVKVRRGELSPLEDVVSAPLVESDRLSGGTPAPLEPPSLVESPRVSPH